MSTPKTPTPSLPPLAAVTLMRLTSQITLLATCRCADCSVAARTAQLVALRELIDRLMQGLAAEAELALLNAHVNPPPPTRTLQ